MALIKTYILFIILIFFLPPFLAAPVDDGTTQNFLARAQCTPHTQILPLIFNQLEILGIPLSIKSYRWMWLLRCVCHDD